MTIDELKKAGTISTSTVVDNKLVTETFTYEVNEVDLDIIRQQKADLIARKAEIDIEIAEKEAVLI